MVLILSDFFLSLPFRAKVDGFHMSDSATSVSFVVVVVQFVILAVDVFTSYTLYLPTLHPVTSAPEMYSVLNNTHYIHSPTL